MNPFRYHLLINLIGLVIGIGCPSLYFAGKSRFGVALCLGVLMLTFGHYPWLFGCFLVIGSVTGQIRTDYKYRRVLIANAKNDRLYRFTAHLLSLFGLRIQKIDTITSPAIGHVSSLSA